MTDDTPLPFDLPAVCRKKLTVDFNGCAQSSDGGLLLLRAAERKVGVCARLAAAMPDRRNPDRIQHEMIEMVMARSSAIASDDAIDLDRLRHDPVMKVVVGRCPETGEPLASQSTISRMENSASKKSLRPRRGDGVDRRGRRRLHFWPPRATQRSMRWQPTPPTICASTMPGAASRRCEPGRALPTRQAAGRGLAR
jgi:hypothetical protein